MHTLYFACIGRLWFTANVCRFFEMLFTPISLEKTLCRVRNTIACRSQVFLSDGLPLGYRSIFRALGRWNKGKVTDSAFCCFHDMSDHRDWGKINESRMLKEVPSNNNTFRRWSFYGFFKPYLRHANTSKSVVRSGMGSCASMRVSMQPAVLHLFAKPVSAVFHHVPQ